jgi:hypothetical protein
MSGALNLAGSIIENTMNGKENQVVSIEKFKEK